MCQNASLPIDFSRRPLSCGICTTQNVVSHLLSVYKYLDFINNPQLGMFFKSITATSSSRYTLACGLLDNNVSGSRHLCPNKIRAQKQNVHRELYQFEITSSTTSSQIRTAGAILRSACQRLFDLCTKTYNEYLLLTKNNSINPTTLAALETYVSEEAVIIIKSFIDCQHLILTSQKPKPPAIPSLYI